MKRIRKTVSFRWFISYFVIVVLALSAGVGVSAYGRSLVKSQTRQIYETMLQQVQMDVDTYLHDVYRVYARLPLNSEVGRVFSQLTQTAAYDDYQATQSMLSYLADNPNLEDIFVYNSNTGRVVGCSGHLDMEYFYDLYYANSGIALEDLEGYLSNQNLREYYLVHGARQSLLFFSHSIPYSGAGRAPVNACVVLDLNRITGRLENSQWDEGVSLAVLDDTGAIITFIGEEEIPQGMLDQVSGSEQAETDSRAGVVFAQASTVVPWQYVVYAPSSLYTSLTSQLTLVTSVVMVVCATLCVFLTLFFIRGNYRPLRETMNIFSSSRHTTAKHPADDTKNEFMWLQETARRYVEEMDHSQSTLQQYHKRLQSQLLLRLLESPFDTQRDPREMEAVGLEFKRPHFLVLHFYFDDSQALLLSNDIEKGRGALGFAIVNVFSELLGSGFHVEPLDMVGRITVLLNFTADDSFGERLRETVFAAQEYIGDRLGAVVQCGAGAVHTNAEGIYLSSKEATEAAAYLSSGGTEGAVFYEDVKNLLQVYEYPLELEHLLLDALTTCNGKNAVKYLRQVLAQNVAVVGEMRRCLLMDLTGTLIKAADIVGNPSLTSGMELTEVAVRGEEKQLEARVLQFCERLSAERQDSTNHRRLMKQVRTYVEEHFADPGLNVSRIGSHFNMTPAYLSSLFREETGVSLLEYITTRRLRKAKEQLKNGSNLQEVSLAAGFRNSSAFIRVFKRQEGTTPGQWVENQQ